MWQGLEQRSACVTGLTTEGHLSSRAYDSGLPVWQGLQQRSACIAGLMTEVCLRCRPSAYACYTLTDPTPQLASDVA